MVDNLDFTKDIQEILGDVSKIFSSDSDQIILEKLQQLQIYINQLLALLELATKKGRAKGKKAARRDLTPMMKNAYQIIMQFRTALLGKSEEIYYRLYIHGESFSDTSIIDINESKLMELVERSGNTLRLKRTLDDSLKVFQNQQVQNIFDQHINSILNSLKSVERGVVVPFPSVSDIFGHQSEAPNLYWQVDTTRGRSAYTPKIYNYGWIYQAIDATIADLYENTNSEEELSAIDTQTFRRIYFQDHLNYDNVVGFKGGDVGLRQIKANFASLMNARTLISYLKIIQQILQPSEFDNKKELEDFIKSSFLEDTQNINQGTIKMVSNVADRLISILPAK